MFIQALRLWENHVVLTDFGQNMVRLASVMKVAFYRDDVNDMWPPYKSTTSIC